MLKKCILLSFLHLQTIFWNGLYLCICTPQLIENMLHMHVTLQMYRFREQMARKISFCKVLMINIDVCIYVSPKINVCCPIFFLSPFSAAEWSQALLYRIKTEPLHQQEHEGHLPRFHREAGLYWRLVPSTHFFYYWFTSD